MHADIRTLPRIMMRSLALFALPILLLSTTSDLRAQRGDSVLTISILHINDVHAQNTPMTVTRTRDGVKSQIEVGGYAVIKGYVDSLRRLNPNSIFLHAGDDFQGTPISTITKGASQFDILALVHPDAMTIGNHEFDYGRVNLEPMLARAPFPIVSANLFDKDKGRTFVAPSTVMTVAGVTIGIFGLAPPDLATLTYRENVRGLEVLDPVAVSRDMVRKLRHDQHCDIVIALSHMGVEADTALARAVTGIDVIVGGHSHTALFKPIRMPGTVVVQTGGKGRWIGKLDLTIDAVTHRITRSWGELIETVSNRVTPDAAVAAKVNAYEAKVNEGLSEVIGTLETEWRRAGGARESNVGDWMADAMRAHAKTDLAFQNSGGIRKDMMAGPIRLRDIWEISPFGNELVTFRLTGAQLLRAVEHQALKSREFAQISGMRYRYDAAAPEGARLVVTVAGAPVDTARVYTAVTNNFVGSHLWDYFQLPEKETPVAAFSPPITDRDLFIDAVRAQKTIRSVTDGRIDIRRPDLEGDRQ